MASGAAGADVRRGGVRFRPRGGREGEGGGGGGGFLLTSCCTRVPQLYLQRGAFDFYVPRQDNGVQPLRLSGKRRLKTTCRLTAGDDR